MAEPEKTIAVKSSTRDKLRRIKKRTGQSIKHLIDVWATQQLIQLSTRTTTHGKLPRRAASHDPLSAVATAAGASIPPEPAQDAGLSATAPALASSSSPTTPCGAASAAAA